MLIRVMSSNSFVAANPFSGITLSLTEADDRSGYCEAGWGLTWVLAWNPIIINGLNT